jgi:hypothetical protein
VVNFTPRPSYLRERATVPMECEGGGPQSRSGRFRRRENSLAPDEIRTPHCSVTDAVSYVIRNRVMEPECQTDHPGPFSGGVLSLVHGVMLK